MVPAEPTAPPRESIRGGLIRAAAQYSIGSALGLLGSILRVAMTARLLSPDVNGIWLGLQLIVSYGTNLHFGVLFGMLRSVPLLRARGNHEQAEEVKGTALTFILILSALGVLATIVAARFLPQLPHRRYLIATGLLTILNWLKAYYSSLFKAESRFREIAISSGAGAVVALATLGLIWVAGLDGLIWGMIAQCTVETLILVGYTGRPKLSFSLRVLYDQISFGFLTLLTSVATVLLTSIDRTVMLQRLGATATGYYYLGANIIVLLPLLAALPGTVLTPRLVHQYGKTGRSEDLLPWVVGPVRVFAVGFAAILGVGALALPSTVAHLWPNLIPGNPAAQVAIIATFPIVIAGFVTNVFFTLNRQLVQLVVLVLGSGVSYGCAWLAVRIWPTITAAAAGSAIGTFAYFIGTVLTAYWLMLGSARKAPALLRDCFLPLLFAGGLVVAITLAGDRVLPPASIVRGALSEVVFAIAMGPWVLRAIRELRGIRR